VMQQQQIHMQEANQQQQQRRRMLSLLLDNAAAVPPQFGATGTRRLQQLRERRALTSAEANAAPGGAAESAAPAGAPAAARKSTVTARDGDPSLNRAQRLLRAALYVWSSIMNLVGISSVWARCADSFSPEVSVALGHTASHDTSHEGGRGEQKPGGGTMGRMDAAPLFSCACGHWAQMCVTVVTCHRVVIRVVSVVRSVFQLYNKKGAVKHHGEADYPITCDALPHHLHHLCRLVHACLASSLLVQRWDSLLVRL
jgi:hypothetical protein